MLESACGMASTPAPTMVLTRLITEDAHDALPLGPCCDFPRRRWAEEARDWGREGWCSEGVEWMAA